MVKLQSCVIGQGNRGQKTYTYTDHSTVWAKVEQSQRESIVNMNLEAGSSLDVTIYKVKTLDTRWRVLIDGKAYSIVSIDPISRFSQLCTLSLISIE